MRPRRVVITGIGVVAPNGIGKDEFWDSLIRGRSGISRVSRFDVSDLPTQIAGEIKSFNPEHYLDSIGCKHMGLQSQYGLVAAKMALDDSDLVLDSSSDRVGTVIGCSNPSYDLIENQIISLDRGVDHRLVDKDILSAADPFSTSILISTLLKARGASRAITTSCAAGLNALGMGFSEISHGNFDVMIAGSADSALSRFPFMSFCGVGMMSKRNSEPERASRPFDRERDGGVLSEGAAILILESYENAVARGASIYGEIVGYSETAFGAHNRNIRKSMAKSMRHALESARLIPREIDYISAHGPSDRIIDRLETEAIKEVFGDFAYRVPISSIKSITGNALSASGVMQVVSSCLSLSHGIISPTWNYEHPDPFCDLDYVPNQARRNNLNFILINSHTYNGTDSSLIIKRSESY